MVKPHGLVLDFVGIFDKLERALAFDSDEVNAIVKDLALLKQLFQSKMETKAPAVLALVKGRFDDKDVDNLIEHFRDKGRRKEFFKEYRNQKDAIVGSGFAAGSVDVGLSKAVLWDAVLQAGATNLSADFTHVKLDSLTLRTGASGVDLRLGDVPESVTTDKVAIKAGVSSVNIALPKDAATRIVAHDGLSSTNVVGDFARQGDGSWETPGFGSASHAYEISIESGVGSVSIKQE